MGLASLLFRSKKSTTNSEDDLSAFDLFIKKQQEFWQAINKNKPKQKTLDQLRDEFKEYQFPQLRQICRHTPSIVNARIVLREHVFKNRFEWIPAFGSKCTNLECGAEYEQVTSTCEHCGAKTREPDQKQQEQAELFFKSVNDFDQSLIEVLQAAEDEINMTDNATIWLDTEYTLNSLDPEGYLHITHKKVKAIESIPPEYVQPNLDQTNGRHLDQYFCIQHRDQIHNKEGYCPICGTPLLQAWYHYDDHKEQGKDQYYARDEIIDWHFYDPKGYSPIYAILKPVLVEWGMDDELYERFWHKTLPKDIIAVITSNTAALDKVKKAIIEQAKNNEVPFVGIESSTGRGAVQKIPLTDDTVTDLTNVTTRDQIKKIINTVYGIVPLYSADVERSSALSGEGQQLLVQEDRAKAKQASYNEKILPQLLKSLGVTDWKLELKPPTEESEQKKLTIEGMKIQNASAMLQMGFTVELDENGEFVFSGEASRQDTMMPSPFTASMQKSVEEPIDQLIEKKKVYIKDPSEAPEGADVQQGARGGYYYESTQSKKKSPEFNYEIANAKMIGYSTILEMDEGGKEKLEAVKGYSAVDYILLNEYLRSGTLLSNSDKKEDLEKRIKLIDDFIENAPKIEGTVYRGMHFFKDEPNAEQRFNDFLAELEGSGEVELPAFSSTTPKKDVAETFAARDKSEKAFGILIEMQTKAGVYLDGTSELPDEHEVLLKRNSKFTLKEIQREEGYAKVILQEA